MMEKANPVLIADLHERIRQRVVVTIKSGQLTQVALAKLIGVQQAHISNFLLNKRRLSIETMDAVLNVLGLDATSLVAMSDRTRLPKDWATRLESVPLIRLRAVMASTFTKNDILGEIGYTKTLVQRIKAEPTNARSPWVRFIAVRADTALAAPMYPRFENGSVLLVDRHHCLFAGDRRDEPKLYLIRKEEALMIRWVELQGTQLCLRPQSSNYPLDFICIDKKNTLTSCLVGRVAYIATET